MHGLRKISSVQFAVFRKNSSKYGLMSSKNYARSRRPSKTRWATRYGSVGQARQCDLCATRSEMTYS